MEEESDSVGGAVSLFGDIESAREPADIGGHRLILPTLFGVSAILGFVPGGFFAQEHNKVGILLDRTRFAEMVKGGFGVGFLRFTIQLGQDHDRNLEFHGEGFEATGNFRNLDLAVFLATTGSRSEELEIIDDQDIDTVLFFDSAGASPELADRE